MKLYKYTIRMRAGLKVYTVVAFNHVQAVDQILNAEPFYNEEWGFDVLKREELK
tara:strand:- start:155 stop:316 length:162 start_codon:yes stop_codon:yes gene_type:complete